MKQENCLSLVARDAAVIAPCQHLSYFPLVVERIDGAWVTDADGNTFLDFLTSGAALNLGGNHPAVTNAIHEQLKKFPLYTGAYSYNRPMVEYAERLASVYPGGVLAKVCFGNCGSDANDAAVKFARAFTGRHKIITFLNGYHGSTLGAVSLSSVTTRMRSKIGPLLQEVYHFPFFGADVDEETCRQECLKQLKAAFATYLPPEDVAAVIFEPIQGDGGMLSAHPVFMAELYALCKAHSILFICEEVQQAFFRAGYWFSIESYPGIIPDGIILGKFLGAGLTLGAFMGRAEILDALPAPAHVFTASGNPLACAAGIAAFDVLKDSAFQAALGRGYELIKDHVQALMAAHPAQIGFIRGQGMSYGLGITRTGPRGERVSDPKGAYKIAYRSYETGLILITLAGNVLRIQPPLTITPKELKIAFAILSRAIDDFAADRIPDTVLANQGGW